MASSGIPEDQLNTLLDQPVDTPLRQTLRRFRRHRLAMVGVVIIVVLGAGAALGSGEAALKQTLADANLPPSAAYWFGTDANGRDEFARTLVGGRVSLLVGLVAVFFSTAIGTVLGSIAGYYRAADYVIMRAVDIVMSFPTIVLLLVAVSILGPGIFNIMLLIGLVTWPVPCRIVRGEFLKLREAEFVIAARCIGLRDRAIILRHLLPNAIAPLIVYASLGVAFAVLTEAGLSYLGLGVQPPTPSWGNMLNAARSLSTLELMPWQWVPPAIMMVTFVLAVNFVGDGLRDALDPHSTSNH
ncbi:MAG TPA: ABC transporter permease [Acidimicrobiales bacterium]|nr:ABC transporter permease [Acidimicrobiales bacterium]